MFTKISLQNFRSFNNIEFDLSSKNNLPKNLAIIYGENGAGKSNLMSAFVLLKELLDTLNVRDAYEEILNQKSIFSDENMDSALKQRLMAGLRDIQAIIEDYRMVDNDEPIIAEFEFLIGENIGKYCVKLGNQEIIFERLEYLINKRRGIYFDCSPGNISINSSVVTDTDLLADIKSGAKRFWGKHSILAIILHEMRDKSESFGWDNITDNFIDVIAEFDMLSCHLDLGSRCWNKLNTPIQVLKDASHGQIQRNEEIQLDIAEKVFTQFFSSINSNIKKVYYKKNYTDKYIDYKLYFKKLVAGEYRDISFFKESTGNHQLLKILCYILCSCLGGTIIFDEADSGIHDVLFQKIILEAQSLINGQLIITTHNTMLMETEFARDSVYILKEEGGAKKTIQSINNYDKRTYSNNNIRNKYLNNEYGGLPEVKPVNFSSLIKLFENELNSKS